MRYLILSDIHSNDEALAAVMARVRRKKYDGVVVLGDFVGYGANPNHVIDRIRNIRKPKNMIRGNHDKVGWQLIGYDGSLNHKAPFGYYDAEYLKMSANPGGKV